MDRKATTSYMSDHVYYVQNNKVTPWSRVVLEKLTVTQLVKKFPTFYGTQMFINMFAKHTFSCIAYDNAKPIFEMTSPS